MPLSRALLGVLALAALPACGRHGKGGDGGTSAAGDYEVLDEGTGPENERPLWPLRVGSHGDGMINGEVELARGRAFRLANRLDDRVDWFYATDSGVYLAGGSLDGEYDNPVLYVPAVARGGMAWEASPGGDAATYTFTVTRLADQDTPFGKRTVWSIERKQDGKLTDYALEFVEGIGPKTFDLAITDPLDAPEAPAPVVTKVALEPLALPADAQPPFTQILRPRGLSMLRPANETSDLLLFNEVASPDLDVDPTPGKTGACVAIKGDVITSVPPDAGKPFRVTTGLTCPTYDRCEGGGCVPYVASAAGAYVSSDGPVYWIPREQDGTPTSATTESLVSVFTDRTVFHPRAFVASPAGPPVVWQTSINWRNGLYVGGKNIVPDLADDLGDGVDQTSTFLPSRVEQTLPLGSGWYLLATVDGLLATTRLDGKRTTPPVAQFRYTGRLSVKATVAGHEILQVTGDGSVDRIVAKDGNLSLEHVADAALPKGETAVGAFLVGDAPDVRLLVATTHDGGRNEHDLPVLSMSLWRSAAALPPVVPGTPPTAAGLTLDLAGGGGGPHDGAHDLLLCWPKDGAAVDLASLTLTGAKPTAVEPLAGEPCALIVRDDASRFATDGPPAYVEGVLPGVGKFIVTPLGEGPHGPLSNRGLHDGDNVEVAPRKGGGFYSQQYAYGAGGVVTGVPVGAIPGAQLHGVPDLGGAGLWLPNVNITPGLPAEGKKLVLVGDHTLETRFTQDGAQTGVGFVQTVMFPALGGGIVLRVAAGTEQRIFHVAGDGTQTRISPKHPGSLCGYLADDTVCGMDDDALPSRVFYCVDPSGAERRAPVGNGAEGPYCDESFLPLPDGTLVGFGPSLVALDPQAMTATALPEGWSEHWSRTSDGRLYGVVGGAPVELTKNGTVPVTISDAVKERLKTFPAKSVVADEKYLLLELSEPTREEDRGFYRIPRP